MKRFEWSNGLDTALYKNYLSYLYVYCSASSRRYTDFARAMITRDIFIPGPTRSGLSRSLTNRQNTQHVFNRYLARSNW